MNQTPRTVNRVVLVLLGLIFTAGGLHGLLLSAFPGYAEGWHGLAGRFGSAVGRLLSATTLPGQRDSWLWILVAVALIALILLMLWWVAVQGKGKTGIFAREYHDHGDREHSARGIVEIASGVPEHALKAALASRSDIVSVHVSTWESRTGDAGLRIKVQPRLGAAPHRIADDVSALVSALDRTLGRQGPVVIHLASGARTRMSRAERVL